MTSFNNNGSSIFSPDHGMSWAEIALVILRSLMSRLKGDVDFGIQEFLNDMQEILLELPGLLEQRGEGDSAVIVRSILEVLQSFPLARDFEQRQHTAQRSLRPGRRIMEAIPKLRGLREIIEKLPQNPSTPSTVISMLSELRSILESLCKFSFAAFSVVIRRVGRIRSHCCPSTVSPTFDRHKHRINDPYSNHTRHRIPAKLYQSPEAKVPPDRSSTRDESDFCSSITTVQRMSPLRLFKIRWNLVPIIFPNL